MNAATVTTINATSADISTRIEAERNRLAIEAHLKDELDRGLTEALEGNNDEALTQIETSIAECLAKQARISERITLLQKSHSESLAKEADANLDALTAESRRAREIGEQLFAQYAKQAATLVPLLTKLQAIDTLIVGNDWILTEAKRDPVGSPNNARITAADNMVLPLYKVVELPFALTDTTPIWDAVMQRDERYGLIDYRINEHDLALQSARDDAVTKLRAELSATQSVSSKKHKSE